MPRTESFPLNCVISDRGHSKGRVLILHNDLLSSDDGENDTPDIVKLRHPRSGRAAMFLFSRDESIVQEVFSLSEKRSWFINDSVMEEGKMNFSTPIDPLFLVLPYLKKSKEEGKVIPLSDLLIDDVFPETFRLLKSSVTRRIHLLADRKGPEDLNAWMYNEEKTLRWLCKKVEKVSDILKEKQINVHENAVCRNFVKSVKKNCEESYLKYAYELIAEYLTAELSSKLSMSLNLLEEMEEKKHGTKRRSSLKSDEDDAKKGKWANEVQVRFPVATTDHPKALTVKEKALKKAANGSKAITFFFKNI